MALLLAAALAIPAAPALADDLAPVPPAPVTDAGFYADSPMSLTDVDLFTGAPLADAGNAFGLDQLLVNDLADSGQLAFDTQLLAEQVRTDALARRRAEEQRLAAAVRASVSSAAQTEIGPDGCPVASGPRTLRGGAEHIGVHALCVRSVAAAPTAAAATAIKYAFANLGVPYSRTDRMGATSFDCSSYVMRAYASAGVPTLINGWAPTTRQIAPYPGYRSYPWLETVAYDEGLPGDLLVTPPTRDDGGGHVMMLLADGFMIHTAATGDVSHVTGVWPESKILVVRRVRA